MLRKLEMPFTILCGVFLLGMYLSMIPAFQMGHLENPLAYAAIAFGCVYALQAGWRSIKRKSLDVNLLMLLAAICAVVVGHPDDAAALLFLFSLSSSLESLAMGKTESAIEALVKLQPTEAIRLSGGTEETVPVEHLRVGDRVKVLPFENVPIDGNLLSEFAEVNTAVITGESMPTSVARGANVAGGTQNLDSTIELEVSREVEESSLTRILNLVKEAQENKASGERISAWFGARYTSFVLLAFTLSIAIRVLNGGTAQEALYASLVLLVALSPCALVISSPASALSALAWAGRKGILVRGGQFLEEAGKVDVVALDKTGTLTLGEPEVVEVCLASESLVLAAAQAGACHNCQGGCDCLHCWHVGAEMSPETRGLVQLVASAEANTTHPIGVAITAFAKAQQVDVSTVTSSQTLPGLGVIATVDGQHVEVGQPRMFGDDIPRALQIHVEEMRQRGLTSVLVRIESTWAALGLRDQVREISQEFVRNLKKAGVKETVMLTGDNSETAKTIADQVGVDSFHASLDPSEKKSHIDKLVAQGKTVMMVGDGVNDSPALSSAHLGVAMGGLGSEAALRSADVVLVQDRIELLPDLLKLGQKTNRIIRWNLIFAASVIVTLVVSSFFTVLPLTLAVIGHEGSTAIVVINALRLLSGPSAKPFAWGLQTSPQAS